MASVLAIVSKALFEKMGKDMKVGTVIDTDRYVTSNKTFDGIEDGDAIFLVTVRPPDEKLWLVGILANPKRKGTAWVAAANTAPIADVTTAIKKLKFESGTGIKAKKGALGMSLQTPRALTAADVTLLRGFVAGKKSSGKVAASAAYREAVEEAVGSKKKSKSKSGNGAGKLRLEHYRKPFEDSIDDLEPFEKKQLAQLASEDLDGGGKLEDIFGSDDDELELKHMEVVDVLDAEDQIKFQLYLWPYGSGALFANGTTKLIGNVCQHHFELVEQKGKAFVQDLAKAWAGGKKRLKIQEMVIFGGDSDDGDGDD